MSESTPATPVDATAPAVPMPRWIVVVWALLVGAVLLVNLGGAPLFDVDEGAFAEATREMITSGDYGSTTLNGADRFDKPILVYWLQALSMTVLGPTTVAARLPSALCAWVWCLALAAFMRPRYGRLAAGLGGLMLATCFGVAAIGRAATADALLNMLLALTCFDLWRALSSNSRALLRRCAVWMALGLLTKGPVAVVVPGGALVLWWLAADRATKDRTWRLLLDGWSWLLLVAIAAPWYVYALNRHGMAFVDGFIFKHNLKRYTGTLESHGGGVFYYLIVLPFMVLPWTPLLVSVARRARGWWQEPLGRFLLLWFGFVFVFFSLSGTKLPHYLMYGLTPLVIMMSAMLARIVVPVAGADRADRAAAASSNDAATPPEEVGSPPASVVVAWADDVNPAPSAGPRMHRPAAVGVLLLLLLGLLLPFLAAPLAPKVKDGLYRASVAAADDPWLAIQAAALPALIALLLLLRVLWVRRPTAATLGTLACGGVAAMLTWHVAIVPWWGHVLQGPVLQAGELARQIGQPVVQWGIHRPSFAYYAGRPAPQRAAEPGELALVRLDKHQTAEGQKLLYSAGGFGLIEVRGPEDAAAAHSPANHRSPTAERLPVPAADERPSMPARSAER